MYYEGDFVNGILKNGRKYEIMLNGDEYLGEIHDEKYHGQGKLIK
jgi:hypothetical protein